MKWCSMQSQGAAVETDGLTVTLAHTYKLHKTVGVHCQLRWISFFVKCLAREYFRTSEKWTASQSPLAQVFLSVGI